MKRQWWRLAALTLLCAAAPWAWAELPVESARIVQLPAQDAYRVYLGDPVMGHLVDGRTHVVDGNTMQYLGMVDAGYAGASALSRDGKQLYVAATYYDRLTHGTRTDVVEIHDTADLSLRGEIVIPSKHAQSLPMKALLATSADDRYLLVQNATPATSVTVVDLAAKKVLLEIANPGCYGVIPWPDQPLRFSSICGDGTLATYGWTEQGQPTQPLKPLAFFDPDKDPVYVHYELDGKRLLLLSYLGQVHELTLDGEQPAAGRGRNLIDAAARKQHWRPGGFQVFALEPRSQRLFVGMHRNGAEGSHKNPADEIWVVELASGKRQARVPGHMALGMTMAKTDRPRLFVLSAKDNRLLSFDIPARAIRAETFRPARTSAPMGETPVYLTTP